MCRDDGGESPMLAALPMSVLFATIHSPSLPKGNRQPAKSLPLKRVTNFRPRCFAVSEGWEEAVNAVVVPGGCTFFSDGSLISMSRMSTCASATNPIAIWPS